MTLTIYPFILETIRLFVPIIRAIEEHDRSLGDQLRRALASIALNTGEGAGNRRGNRRSRFETACGSAKESRCAYQTADALGYVVLDAVLCDRLDRIAATTWKLSR
ncbi:MAG TPA: four helix bundle protein [Polyangiaceae bacterium]